MPKQTNMIRPLTAAQRQKLSKAGRKGGRNGRGKSKARSSSKARAAVLERWRRYRTAHMDFAP